MCGSGSCRPCPSPRSPLAPATGRAALAERGGRIRLVGEDARATAEAVGGSPAVALYAGPVLSAGRLEMLPFLREQAVSISAHRFGTPRRHAIPAFAAPAGEQETP